MQRKNIANFFTDFVLNDSDEPVSEIEWLVMNLEQGAFESLVELHELKQQEKAEYYGN